MKITFGKDCAYKITDEKIKKEVTSFIEDVLNIKLKNGQFVGPQPVAVEKKDFGTLLSKRYVVCEKTDGERYMMILLNVNKKPMCFMINRNNEYFFLNFSFKREVFEGTILDGEMILNKNNEHNYMVHDLFTYCGVSFIEKSHDLRYAAIIDFISTRYIVNKNSDSFNIKTKIFYNYSKELLKIWEHITNSTENKIDGLIFTPVDQPVKYGRQEDLYKWKEPGNNTIDLLVKKTDNKFSLFGSKKSGNYLVKIFKENHPNYEIIHDFFLIHVKKNISIIEFKYSTLDDDEIFTPYRIRTDKSVPNSEQTINNSLKNFREAININDFVF